ncbi:MAG: SsrA-binding protein SmpB [Candidatus Aminicenantia bacterium]
MKKIATNKKGYSNYQILETIETGIALSGNEVKSLRLGMVNIKDSYAVVRNGEVFLINLHIAPYPYSSPYQKYDPERERKLLLHKSEIRKLYGKVREKGLTLIPLDLYFNERGKVKVKLALAKGMKKWEKKEVIKEREIKKEIGRELKKRFK